MTPETNDQDWLQVRIEALDHLLSDIDFQGYDPFDLLNAPVFKRFARGRLPRLLISRFGSRLAPHWLRRLLCVPPVLDPKTLACAYFAYKFNAPDRFPGKATQVATRLAAMTRDDRPTWGYPFDWPTRADGENPAGQSTLVPTSFAMFALAAATASGDGNFRNELTRAAEFIVREHTRENEQGPFLGYFAHSSTNTHNANLLGCVALVLSARLTDNADWIAIAKKAAASSARAVQSNGFLPYHDVSGGDWTDCFHHVYAIAAFRALLALDAAPPEVDEAFIARLHGYLDQTFPRPDGSLDYYPGKRFPIDCHNGAATAIYALSRPGKGAIQRESAESLLRAFDTLTWLPKRKHYVHRIWSKFRDKRMFPRWNQAWMFWAASAVAHPNRVDQLLSEISAPTMS